MNFSKILLMKYLHPDTDDIVGVDIIGYEKASSYHVASVIDLDDALSWARQQDTKIDIAEDYVACHGDTPVFNLFESALFT